MSADTSLSANDASMLRPGWRLCWMRKQGLVRNAVDGRGKPSQGNRLQRTLS